jgi:hypothetical protein
VSSDRKVAANKRNSSKSCGPRTAAGKATASRNALKHGLSAVVNRQPAPSAEIEQLAKAFCGTSENSELLAQARIIAANALVLRVIVAQKLAVVERLREPTAIAFAKGDNSLELGKARLMQSRLAGEQIDELVPRLLEKYKDKIESKGRGVHSGLIVPDCLLCLLEQSDSMQHERRARQLIEERERNEFQALEEAAADLIRLDRYEGRSWSQQKRAINNFINLRMAFPSSNHSPEQSNRAVVGRQAFASHVLR